MTHRIHRGFTIIELMLVVTTLGLLASVAVPSFRSVELRAKQAERNILMTTIQRAVDDYYVRENHYPLTVGARTYLYLTAANPDATPTSSKRPWRYTAAGVNDHWVKLSLSVQGSVYYSYDGLAYEQPGTRYTYLEARGDLDGDRVIDQLERYWTFTGTQLVRVAGATCSDCTNEIRTPANGLAF